MIGKVIVFNQSMRRQRNYLLTPLFDALQLKTINAVASIPLDKLQWFCAWQACWVLYK